MPSFCSPLFRALFLTFLCAVVTPLFALVGRSCAQDDANSWTNPHSTLASRVNAESRPNDSARNSNGEIGKIYMLTVWTGTARDATKENNDPGIPSRDYDFKLMVESSREFFESNLGAIGLDASGGDKDVFGEYVVLSGADTTPQKIVDVISDLASKAGENDALFVYILAPGVAISTRESYGEETTDVERDHHLATLIEGEGYRSLFMNLISRSNLLYVMRSHKHRLDVLITDSCTSAIDAPFSVDVLHALSINAPGGARNKTFRYLLTHAKGAYSWNSANTNSCWRLRFGGSEPIEMSDLEETLDASERSCGAPRLGTVFNLAFIQAASRIITNPENGYDFDDFFQDLGMDYDDLYGEFWTYGRRLDWIVSSQFQQVKTTLTAFNAEDDRTSDSMRNKEIMLKTNNRVKKTFVHRDHNEGSGKTGDPTVLLRIDVDEHN